MRITATRVALARADVRPDHLKIQGTIVLLHHELPGAACKAEHSPADAEAATGRDRNRRRHPPAAGAEERSADHAVDRRLAKTRIDIETSSGRSLRSGLLRAT